MADHFETKAIHAGQEPDQSTGSATVPIYATTTYAQEAPGVHKGYEYSRTDNPTRAALERAIAALEGAPAESGGLATASGMAATALVSYLLKPGDHLIFPDDAYGGTYRFFVQVLGEYGVEWSAIDQTDLSAVESALRPTTKMIWVETPTNPYLRIVDLEAMTALASGADALLAVDNTFATPYLQRPLELGADIVIHSTTKYLGGHSDVIGGAIVVGDDDLGERLAFLQNAVGPVPGPFDCYLVLRGLKTLPLRIERHSSNALAVAEFLEGHPAVGEVFYPGLAGHPQHDLAAAQMAAFGGVLSFKVAGGAEAASKVVSSTRLFILAESLGAVESLIELPAVMTHASVAGTPLEVPPDVVRASVGIEHVDDLIADLDQALSAAG